MADTFFLPKRVKDIELFSFHVQVFGFCFLKEGHILLFMFFYCPGNREKERMVTSDARQRKQEDRNLSFHLFPHGEIYQKESHLVWLSAKCSSLSSGEQDVVLALASAFAPESFLLRRSMLCCPSSSFMGGSVWSSTFENLCLMHVDIKGWSSWGGIILFWYLPLHLFFLNKSDPFFLNNYLCECVQLWVFPHGKLSPCLPKFILQLLSSSHSGWSRPCGWWSSNFCAASHFIVFMTAYESLKFHAACWVLRPSCPLIHPSDEHNKDLWSWFPVWLTLDFRMKLQIRCKVCLWSL